MLNNLLIIKRRFYLIFILQISISQISIFEKNVYILVYVHSKCDNPKEQEVAATDEHENKANNGVALIDFSYVD